MCRGNLSVAPPACQLRKLCFFQEKDRKSHQRTVGVFGIEVNFIGMGHEVEFAVKSGWIRTGAADIQASTQKSSE